MDPRFTYLLVTSWRRSATSELHPDYVDRSLCGMGNFKTHSLAGTSREMEVLSPATDFDLFVVIRDASKVHRLDDSDSLNPQSFQCTDFLDQ